MESKTKQNTLLKQAFLKDRLRSGPRSPSYKLLLFFFFFLNHILEFDHLSDTNSDSDADFFV